MLLRRTLALAAVSLALGGGCAPLPQGPGASSPSLDRFDSGGTAVVIKVDSAAAPADAHLPPAPVPQAPVSIGIEGRDYSLLGTTADALLVRHAAGLVGCPQESMTAREVVFGVGHQAWQVKLAEGCGQRVVYGEQRWRDSQPYVGYTVVSRLSLVAASAAPP